MTLPAALPPPIGRQREVLYLPAPGRTVVLGTAGSVKTVLADPAGAVPLRPGHGRLRSAPLRTFNRLPRDPHEGDLGGAHRARLRWRPTIGSPGAVRSTGGDRHCPAGSGRVLRPTGVPAAPRCATRRRTRRAEFPGPASHAVEEVRRGDGLVLYATGRKVEAERRRIGPTPGSAEWPAGGPVAPGVRRRRSCRRARSFGVEDRVGRSAYPGRGRTRALFR